MADLQSKADFGNLASSAQKETAAWPVREPALPSVSRRRTKLGTLSLRRGRKKSRAFRVTMVAPAGGMEVSPLAVVDVGEIERGIAAFARNSDDVCRSGPHRT
jgi:hypothetical protein